MTIPIKTLEQTEQLITGALIKEHNTGIIDPSQKIDPSIRNQLAISLVRAVALGIHGNNKNIQKATTEAFLGGTLWTNFWGPALALSKFEASSSDGLVVFTGTVGTSIPSATLITNANGIQYETQSSVTISNQTINVASLIRIGNRVIVETVDEHNFTNGVLISILGANELDYNVINQVIQVTGLKTFEFSIATTPTTPATGTITISFASAVANVLSVTLGANTNVGGNIELTLLNPIVGVNSSVFTDFNGISGGLDVETDISYNSRVIEKFQSYFAQPFSSIGIPIFLKEYVDGVTRVWVKDAFPEAGKVTIYFVRDFDVNIIPDAGNITAVKNAIINGTDEADPIKPSNTPDDFVIVSAPTPRFVDFPFISLSPDTEDMRSAIRNNLIDFFRNNTDFETSIPREDQYNVIYSTTDSNGNVPTFSIGLTDVIIGSGEIPILGTISF